VKTLHTRACWIVFHTGWVWKTNVYRHLLCFPRPPQWFHTTSTTFSAGYVARVILCFTPWRIVFKTKTKVPRGTWIFPCVCVCGHNPPPPVIVRFHEHVVRCWVEYFDAYALRYLPMLYSLFICEYRHIKGYYAATRDSRATL